MKFSQFGYGLSLLAFFAPLASKASSMDKRMFDDALREIGRFESGTENRWNQVTPDIGRNGISCGILQWSLQEGKLQSLVKRAGKNLVKRTMPLYGNEFWKACTTGNKKEAMDIVLSWQNSTDTYSGTTLKHTVDWRPDSGDRVKEIAALFDSAEMRKIQGEEAQREGNAAWRGAERWARDARGSHASPLAAEFSVFFNLVVMNRTSRLPTFGDVKRLKHDARSGDAVSQALEWLSRPQNSTRQPIEAQKNAANWRSRLSPQKRDLFLLAYLGAKRLDRDNGSFQAIDLSRSGALICGKGWVNGAELVLRQSATSPNDSQFAALHASPNETPIAKIPLPEDYFMKALAVTAKMETSNSLDSEGSWGAIADDFDGGGISCGVLQWNLKSGTLQPLTIGVGKDAVILYMPEFGDKFWQACTAKNKEEARAIILSWQSASRSGSTNGGNGGGLNPAALAELRILFNSPEMKSQQIEDARFRARGAWDYAVNWAKEQRGASSPTLKEFAIFFDTFVHLGGMRVAGDRPGDRKHILNYADVKTFVESRKEKDVANEIFDWLRDVPNSMRQSNEAHQNAELWRKKISREDTDLLVLCYLRSQKATGDSGRVKALALCRRGAILFNEGRVNSATYRFTQLLGARISDVSFDSSKTR